MAYARIERNGNELKFYSSYDSGLVAGLKREIPSRDRRWVPAGKYWAVAPKYESTLIDLADRWLGVTAHVSGNLSTKAAQTEQRLIRVEYIGQAKDRGTGEMVSYGARMAGTKQGIIGLAFNVPKLDWPYAFPEKVLKEFFNGQSDDSSQNAISTLYAVLLVSQSASQQEIKQAYRKMQRRYHPDINKDEDAHEMSQRINEAYNILRNPTKRRKYDAGLKLEALAKQASTYKAASSDWSMPLRCGLIMCEGTERLGRFHVSKILAWNDIVESGRTLVTSWDKSINELRREWI